MLALQAPPETPLLSFSTTRSASAFLVEVNQTSPPNGIVVCTHITYLQLHPHGLSFTRAVSRAFPEIITSRLTIFCNSSCFLLTRQLPTFGLSMFLIKSCWELEIWSLLCQQGTCPHTHYHCHLLLQNLSPGLSPCG